ncbi:hypothetical protein BEP19_13410 [Ammoniphilus oxalaticus]|uniref:NodB homology domain-containing protein n=1 Tax=Ammoniphilus oxalaticus TaxID=66863 RepID=A0A419SF46_9BACL|nr:polysaccharide deacetylase family protein [Ammoniphilus oxalaticus]RKD22066.1 hypothetical protein BEP19_13410 [Ammoniphilus oxalaticus]
MRKKVTILLTWILLFCFTVQATYASQPNETIFRIDTNKKLVALTFDDGPHHTFTPLLLEALYEEGAQATFFLLGKQVQAHPQIAARIHREGHEIGNHGYSHRVMRHLSWKEIHKEIRQTERLIAHHVGIKTHLFRPPYGEMVPRIVDVSRYTGYRLVRWSIDPKDWDQRRNGQVIAEHVGAVVKPGDIVLFHDGGANQAETIKAVRTIVRNLKKRGYKFVTVSELLKQSG